MVEQMLYTPQMVLSMLSAMSIGRAGSSLLTKVAILHVSSWIVQFYGHGAHEKRAPALLDNLVGGKYLITCLPTITSSATSIFRFLSDADQTCH
jgi:uncharacterized membrane protein YGL010W